MFAHIHRYSLFVIQYSELRLITCVITFGGDTPQISRRSLRATRRPHEPRSTTIGTGGNTPTIESR